MNYEMITHEDFVNPPEVDLRGVVRDLAGMLDIIIALAELDLPIPAVTLSHARDLCDKANNTIKEA